MSNETDQAIQQLLDERLKVLQWMDRLSGASQSAPQDVLQRVRRDYQARLDTVARQLEGYQDELAQTLSKNETSRAELSDSERQARDKLAEAELRHHVGEFEDGRWTGLQSEITNELTTVSQKLDQAESEIQRLEEVLGLIKNKPNTQVRKAIPLQEPPPPVQSIMDAVPAPVPDPIPEPEPIEIIPPPLPAPTLEPAQVSGPTKAMDELAFLKSVTEDEQQGPAASKASGNATAPQPIAPERVEAVQTRSDRDASPKKTLKCGECGVMNFPTEWYCERCGAELAAL